MSIQAIAATLLIARAVSMIFIVTVMYRQYKLFGTQIDFQLVPNLTKMQRRNVYRIRRILFCLSVIILLGNLVPILIDAVTLFYNPGRPANVKAISVAYAYSNALTAMFSAIMIWTLYRIAGLGGSQEK
jgi:hypothetical protein